MNPEAGHEKRTHVTCVLSRGTLEGPLAFTLSMRPVKGVHGNADARGLLSFTKFPRFRLRLQPKLREMVYGFVVIDVMG